MMNKKEKSTIEKISDPEEYFEKSGVNNAIRDVSTVKPIHTRPLRRNDCIVCIEKNQYIN